MKKMLKPTIGLFLPAFTLSTAPLVYGIEDSLKKADFNLLVFSACFEEVNPKDINQIKIIFDLINLNHIDGLIISNHILNYLSLEKLYNFIKEREELPIINLMPLKDSNEYCVFYEPESQVRQLVKYFKQSMGINRIALIIDNKKMDSFLSDAFNTIVDELSLSRMENIIIPFNDFINQYMERSNFNGIIFDSEYHLHLFLNEIRNFGIDKNLHLGLLGRDFSYPDYNIPVVKSVFSEYEMGRKAAELVINRLSGKKCTKRTILKARVVLSLEKSEFKDNRFLEIEKLLLEKNYYSINQIISEIREEICIASEVNTIDTDNLIFYFLRKIKDMLFQRDIINGYLDEEHDLKKMFQDALQVKTKAELIEELPKFFDKIGLKNYFIFLFKEDGESLDISSRKIQVINKYGLFEVSSPDIILKDKARYSLFVTPLISLDKQYGFILLDSALSYLSSFFQLPSYINILLNKIESIEKFRKRIDRLKDEVKERSIQLSYQKSHDILTGLLNRNEFEHRIQHIFEGMKRKDVEHSFLFIDLDNFKLINDDCGTLAGDKLLCYVTKILESKIRATDLLGRIGSDEFGVLLASCALDRARSIALNLLLAFQQSEFTWEDRIYSVGLSIGISSTYEGSGDVKDIIRFADLACNYAKEKGGNRVEIYTPEETGISKRHTEIQFVAKINRALKENRFRLFCQNIIPISGKAIAKDKGTKRYEILIRMLDEEDNYISPTLFLPAAEKYNFMPIIDRWVINRFFSIYPVLYKNGSRPVKATINISGASINDERFLDFIRSQFKKYPVKPQNITFEITETVVVYNIHKAIEFIMELKKLGCCFALDDFGSGFSSFNYLKYLPVDYLKIDGNFVRNMVENSNDYAIVESINHIAHEFKYKTVAEFVENRKILKRLKEIKVDYGQGFFIDTPKPLFEQLKILKSF